MSFGTLGNPRRLDGPELFPQASSRGSSRWPDVLISARQGRDGDRPNRF